MKGCSFSKRMHLGWSQAASSLRVDMWSLGLADDKDLFIDYLYFFVNLVESLVP